MKILLLSIIILVNSFVAQELRFIREFGSFGSAISFDIDLNSNLYVIDIRNNTITKFDSLGKEIVNIGGYGWEESTFDEPVSIFTNTLSVYVADKNNDRIQRFDKDLNFLSQFSGNDKNSKVEFAYPSVIEISNIGDLFLLDNDNNRILKFNLTGEFLSEIGGNDAGNFSIDNPKNFTIDRNGNLFVLDGNNIKVFDQFGNVQYKFTPNYEIDKIHSFDNNLLFVKNNRIIIFSLPERKEIFSIDNFPNLYSEQIIDAKISDQYLFLLTPKKFLKYQILHKF